MSIDKQEEENPPTKWSWLKLGHCMGADDFADATTGFFNLDLASTNYDWKHTMKDNMDAAHWANLR